MIKLNYIFFFLKIRLFLFWLEIKSKCHLYVKLALLGVKYSKSLSILKSIMSNYRIQKQYNYDL